MQAAVRRAKATAKMLDKDVAGLIASASKFRKTEQRRFFNLGDAWSLGWRKDRYGQGSDARARMVLTWWLHRL